MNVLHDSMRGWFAASLHEAMQRDERIWCITPDIGYGALDQIRNDFPTRFVNTGAAECLATGIAVGLAIEGKVPFIYTITSFLIYRPYEWLRNYVDHERIPVRLVGSGYDDDYKHDGITHQPWGLYNFVEHNLPNVRQYYPNVKEKIPVLVAEMIDRPEPSFLCLRR